MDNIERIESESLSREHTDWLREQTAIAERKNAYERALNRACKAIRECPEDAIDENFVAQIIHTLSTAAAHSGLTYVSDALDEAVVVFE